MGVDSIIEATMGDVRDDGYELQRNGARDANLTVARLPYSQAFPNPNELVQHIPAAPVVAPTAGQRQGPAMRQEEGVALVEDRLVAYVAPRVERVHEVVLPPVATARRDRRGVFFVPDFAASVVIEVRARVGQLPADVPGNKLIVEREALRLMRKYKVREVDSVAHLPSIIRNYFTNDIHYRVSTSQARMTRFQRWLMGEASPPPTFTPLA